MSRYSDASKAVGWTEPVPPIHFPDLWKILILDAQITQGDWDAYVELFRIYRFAPSPTDLREARIMHRIVAIHSKGRAIFEKEAG